MNIFQKLIHYFTCDGKCAGDSCLYLKHVAKAELLVSLLIMLLIAIIGIILGIAIKKQDYKKAPKGLGFLAETIVSYSDSKITEILGTAYLKFSPYFTFLLFYIPLAFISGLFSLPSPMTYFTIPLCLAFVSWFGIQASAIHFQKIDYLKGFTSPLPTWLPIFVPINMLSKLAPLMSLSIRMFGNALAGTILMFLIYWATGLVSSGIGLGQINIVGVAIAPVLHAYFDIFGAFIQTVIFTTLTLLLIATEIPAPVNIALKKRRKKLS